MPGNVLNAYMTYLNITTMKCRKHYYLNFADGEIETYKVELVYDHIVLEAETELKRSNTILAQQKSDHPPTIPGCVDGGGIGIKEKVLRS